MVTAPALPTAAPAPGREFFVFQGTMGKSDLRVAIECDGERANGVVRIDGTEVPVRGTLVNRRKLTLAEALGKGKKGATLDGDVDGSMLKGSWRDPKAKAAKPFTAGPPNPFPRREDAEFSQPYAGRLGDHTHIRAKLDKKDDGALTGLYRYAKSREDLKLVGKVDAATGTFELTESNGKGERTGRLRGTFLDRRALLARWESPDGKRSFPVVLHSDVSYPETLALPGGGKLVPQEEIKEPNKYCSLSVLMPQLASSDGSKSRDALNGEIRRYFAAPERDELCTGAGADLQYIEDRSYTVSATAKTAVALRSPSYMYSGGAHGFSAIGCPILDLAHDTIVDLTPTVFSAEGRKQLDARVNAALQKDAIVEEEDVHVDDHTTLCIDGSDLVVQFQLNEVGPLATGAPSARIPLKDARAWLTKSEPLFDAFVAGKK